MKALGTDRVAGFTMCAAAIAVALEARTFTVRFLTDPVGPKALPILVAVFFLVGGVFLIVRPEPNPSWPPLRFLGKSAVVALSLLLYALALGWLGFVVSTSLEITVLATLFGGPLRRGAMMAVAYTVVLYLVFVMLLGLSLPIGSLFIVGNG